MKIVIEGKPDVWFEDSQMVMLADVVETPIEQDFEFPHANYFMGVQIRGVDATDRSDIPIEHGVVPELLNRRLRITVETID